MCSILFRGPSIVCRRRTQGGKRARIPSNPRRPLPWAGSRISPCPLFRDVARSTNRPERTRGCITRSIVDSSHTNTVSLLGRTIHTIDHRRRQAPFEWLRLSRPVRISAGHHNSAIATGDSNQLLWIRLPPLNIQHTVTYVLKIDE